MPGTATPTRTLAGTSIPSIAETRRDDRTEPEASEDFSWAEGSRSLWRALGVFGALAVGEGLGFAFVSAGGDVFLIVGAVLFFVAVLIGAAGSSEYGWAVLAAALLAAGVAATAYRGAVLSTWPPARFSGGIVPANGAGAVELGLLVGGTVIVVLGFATSFRSARRSGGD